MKQNLLPDYPALHVPSQIMHLHFEGFSDSHQGVQGDVHIAALHFADVFVAQTRLFSEFLLAQLGRFAVGADLLADDFAIWQWHNH